MDGKVSSDSDQTFKRGYVKSGFVLSVMVFSMLPASVFALEQKIVVVKPVEIHDVLNNPGIGFTTFQRFNGDALNSGTKWTEGFPIDYQPAPKSLVNKDYPISSIAYFRVYWKFIEPQKGQYRWDLIDNALKTARDRGQTLMLRIAPHGTNEESDVPEWYRLETGEKLAKNRPKTDWIANPTAKWLINPENPAYAKEYGNMIRAVGKRYDGDPDLELVDIAIVAAWGEGSGSSLLSEKTRRALLNSYLDSFHKTPLVTQLADKRTVAYTLARSRDAEKSPIGGEYEAASLDEEKPAVGWRADCLGDVGGFSSTQNLMTDFYPENIIELGLSNAWKTGPVSMEACWVMQYWKDKGWDVSYIIEQAIKWHVSSFNAKSSAVPEAWWPQVNHWLNHMGYRFVLRRFAYPAEVGANRKLTFTSWWENKGNAPVYRKYPLAMRLRSDKESIVLLTDSDPRSWMPGDNLYNNAIFIPGSLPDGNYKLDIALVDLDTHKPKIKLAIAGMEPDGWYPLGEVKLKATPVEKE